ncbi:MAG: hypothetical protein JWM34_3709 [Ilumatobacteraceae bacterium]|nr:hypothetical protein [Ilumatobacteraceae bacterium]
MVKGPQRGRIQPDGVLEGHLREGRIYRPPLLAYENLRASDWVRDDLPDLLWPAVVGSMFGDEGILAINRLQDALIAKFETDHFDGANVFDGRLTSLDTVAIADRSIVVEVVRSSPDRNHLVPAELIAIMALYVDAPGTWLLFEPWNPEGLVTPERAAGVLAKAVVDAVSANNALTKNSVLRWALLTGELDMQDELRSDVMQFPGGTNRAMASALIRSSFLAHDGATRERHPRDVIRRIEWARSFWLHNWHATDCMPEEGLSDIGNHDAVDGHEADAVAAPKEFVGDAVGDATESASENEADDVPHLDPVADELSANAVEQMTDLFNRFLAIALDHDIGHDMYQPEKHEVICGLVARAARSAIRTASHPDLWSGEHGMGSQRVLAETEIVLTWMASTNDPATYVNYQRYGFGKRKLLRKQMEELSATFEEPPAMLVEAIDSMARSTGGDRGEAFQEVSVDKNFAGKDLRQMAADTGLDGLYRHVFQPASGIAHGEWWAIEDYAMQRCLNPLHRFHQIPSFDLDYPSTRGFGENLLKRLTDLMTLAVRTLVPDE